jgi:hypothetical protein
MRGEMLFGLNEWVILTIVIALFLSASEIGFRLGRRGQPKSNEPTRSRSVCSKQPLLGYSPFCSDSAFQWR